MAVSSLSVYLDIVLVNTPSAVLPEPKSLATFEG
jgi:hypothetical protein